MLVFILSGCLFWCVVSLILTNKQLKYCNKLIENQKKLIELKDERIRINQSKFKQLKAQVDKMIEKMHDDEDFEVKVEKHTLH